MFQNKENNMNSKALGRFLVLFFIAFLPWSVAFSLFWSEKLQSDIFRFSKEIIGILIVFVYLFDHIKKKIKIQYDIFDILTVVFAWLLVSVSIFQNIPIKWIVYWLRYDVGFLFLILVFRRAFSLWNISLNDILKTFLISGGWMLFLSFLIRYVFDETMLTLLWFGDTVSVWDVGWPPPIYHGIPWAAVIRFQWILEWPNQMASFLLLYIWSYLTFFAKKRKYRFMNILVTSLLFFLLIQTYSRSGYWAALLGIWYVFMYTLYIVWRQWNIWRKYKITLSKVIAFILAWVCIWGVFMFQFGNKVAPIFARHWSTSGHFERMYIGLVRLIDNPFWQWLAQAWPASRAIFSVNQNPVSIDTITDPTILHVISLLSEKNPDFIFNTETYYIPESWYIQLMIEGGVGGIVVFLSIMIIILYYLRDKKYLFAATLWMLLMNLVLHSFESVHTVFVWSSILASVMILPQVSQKSTNNIKIG